MPAMAVSSTSTRPKTVPPQPQIVYYLSSPPSSSTSLLPIPSPNLIPLPLTSLLFSLTHPPLPTSEPSGFFLTCLPDPIGFLYHSASFIRDHLTDPCPSKWRHQLIELILEDEPGLASTSGGRIHVSLHWVGDVMREVRDGKRDMPGAAREFKGVLLHELVHIIQHDGAGSCPGWLIESIADHIRLLAHLDPPHWRKAGQGRCEKGWEDAYDAGARFLTWLAGEGEGGSSSPSGVEDRLEGLSIATSSDQVRSTRTTASPATATRYPHPGSTFPEPNKAPQGRKRRGPFPEIVRMMDARLGVEKWEDRWWEEMTGAGLTELWREYLDYYV